MSNNGPLKGNKYCEAEGGCRIPFIFSWPGNYEKKQSLPSLISTMDIYPTLVELAGGQAHAKLDGKSLIPLIKGEKKGDNHEFLVFSRGNRSRDYVVRSGDYKLRNCTASRLFTVGEHYRYDDVKGDFLYNLKNDLGEKENLYTSMPEKVSHMKKMFELWCEQTLPTAKKKSPGDKKKKKKSKKSKEKQ